MLHGSGQPRILQLDPGVAGIHVVCRRLLGRHSFFIQRGGDRHGLVCQSLVGQRGGFSRICRRFEPSKAGFGSAENLRVLQECLHLCEPPSCLVQELGFFGVGIPSHFIHRLQGHSFDVGCDFHSRDALGLDLHGDILDAKHADQGRRSEGHEDDEHDCEAEGDTFADGE